AAGPGPNLLRRGQSDFQSIEVVDIQTYPPSPRWPLSTGSPKPLAHGVVVVLSGILIEIVSLEQGLVIVDVYVEHVDVVVIQGFLVLVIAFVVSGLIVAGRGPILFVLLVTVIIRADPVLIGLLVPARRPGPAGFPLGLGFVVLAADVDAELAGHLADVFLFF